MLQRRHILSHTHIFLGKGTCTEEYTDSMPLRNKNGNDVRTHRCKQVVVMVMGGG